MLLAESGLTQAEFCRQHSVNQNTLSWWKRAINRRDAKAPSTGARAKPIPFVHIRIVFGRRAGQIQANTHMASYDRMEIQAKEFAGRLVVPLDPLINAIKEHKPRALEYAIEQEDLKERLS